MKKIEMEKIEVDLIKCQKGKVKLLNCVNLAPYDLSCEDNQIYVDKYFNFPLCRLHDAMGMYGGAHFIDVRNIFVDFSKNVDDESNYDFFYSDSYINSVIKTGANIVYRLGITIEHGKKHYTTKPPEDFEKWSKVCEHIIRHYNYGWSNGFYFNIQYWEIWNEPEDRTRMFDGTKEEFYDLYSTTAKYLKECYPEIKIGGYGSCGFYRQTREYAPDYYLYCENFFETFLQNCSTNNIPLDFFSWHLYTSSVDEVGIIAKYVRATLDKYGFISTESHLNEWNYGAGGGYGEEHMRDMIGASFVSGMLSEMQSSDCIDAAMYYCFGLSSAYNGLMDGVKNVPSKTYHVLNKYNEFYSLGKTIKFDATPSKVYAYGAYNENETLLIITNYCNERYIFELNIFGIKEGSTLTFSILNDDKNFETTMTETVSSNEYKNKILLPINTVMSIKIIK